MTRGTRPPSPISVGTQPDRNPTRSWPAGASDRAARPARCSRPNRPAIPRHQSQPDLEVGFLVPDSVDLAGHRGVGVPAGRSVLGRRSVAQGRVPMAVVVLVLEVHR
jgi:hypothetical protein